MCSKVKGVVHIKTSSMQYILHTQLHGSHTLTVLSKFSHLNGTLSLVSSNSYKVHNLKASYIDTLVP